MLEQVITRKGHQRRTDRGGSGGPPCGRRLVDRRRPCSVARRVWPGRVPRAGRSGPPSERRGVLRRAVVRGSHVARVQGTDLRLPLAGSAAAGARVRGQFTAGAEASFALHFDVVDVVCYPQIGIAQAGFRGRFPVFTVSARRLTACNR
jgi:hypothetical protein